MEKTNIKKLKKYSSARSLYTDGVFMDANENYLQWVKIDYSKMRTLNRYPTSDNLKLRISIANNLLTGFTKDNIFVSSGSDKLIDILIRSYVSKGEFVMVMNPSFGMYKTYADINDVSYKEILLKDDFSLDIEKIIKNIKNVKVMFLCSPNNPTGNLINKDEIFKILEFYKGIIVIDEAYIEFAGDDNSFIDLVKIYPNIIILRTFSKAWGMAGIRFGYLIASKGVINAIMKVKDPYDISRPTTEIALQVIEQKAGLKKNVNEIMKLKKEFENKLSKISILFIPTKTNFILVKVNNPKKVFEILVKNKIIVRDRSNLPLLKNVLRISVGSREQNNNIIRIFKECKI